MKKIIESTGNAFFVFSCNMGEVVCVDDVKQIAKTKISELQWAYLSGAAEHEYTKRDNENAFRRYRLRPQVLNDVSRVSLSTTVLGHHVNFPICASPISIMRIGVDVIGSDFPVAVAKGVSAAGTAYSMSSWATSSIEEIAAIAPRAPKFFQVYLYKNRKLVESMIRRAESNGFHGLIITVDSSVPGARYRQRKHAYPMMEYHNAGLQGDIMSAYQRDSEDWWGGLYDAVIDPSVNWSDVEWVQSISSLPIVLKGIVTGEMARKALDYGVAGIIVSNHGGRQLEGAPATIDALPEVVRAVEGRCEVYLDGGVRTGSDVLKALALGARAVFLGRPLVWGAVWKGPEGVQKIFEMLRDEFKIALQLMGCRSIKELQEGKNLVVPQSYYEAKL